MGNSIRLYRGDASRIDEFAFQKTNKLCLVGQGIYLTNSAKIAESYRTKGAHYDRNFDRTIIAKTKNEAIAKAFIEYCKYRKEKENVLAQEFKIKLESNTIEIERIGYYQGPNTDWSFHFREGLKIGYISVFEFPEPYFSRNCLNVDANYPDPEFVRIVKERNLWKDEKSRNLIDIDFNKIIPILKDYGIHGFEYKGGRLGGGKHRAFSIWDEDFVNAHLIERYK